MAIGLISLCDLPNCNYPLIVTFVRTFIVSVRLQVCHKIVYTEQTAVFSTIVSDDVYWVQGEEDRIRNTAS